MRLEVAHLLQPVAIIAGDTHQAVSCFIGHILPPQAKEQYSVAKLGKELIHARHQALSGLILGVLSKGKLRISIELVLQNGHLLILADDR